MSTPQLKRKASADLANNRSHPPPEPRIGRRRIVTMMISWGSARPIPMKVMLDSGSAVPLLSQAFVRKHNVPVYEREFPLTFGTFSGSVDKSAGKVYTYPLLLVHKEHFSKESFEVSPLDPESDTILPCWWLDDHRPANLHGHGDIIFNNSRCLENCTQLNVQEATFEYDDNLANYDPDVKVGCLGFIKCSADGINTIEWSILVNKSGVISAVDLTAKVGIDISDRIPTEYHEYLSVFNRDAADALPPHRSFDHAIDLKEGEEPPWGPIYALSPTELKALKEYLEEMLRTGKIRPSKSPAGAPILFVPKSQGRGL